jgi:hypothetical protein
MNEMKNDPANSELSPFVDQLMQQVADLAAERNSLFEAVVIAEALNAQFTGMLLDAEHKRLAAMIVAGDMNPHDYEQKRAKANEDMLHRLSMMREKATQVCDEVRKRNYQNENLPRAL